MNAPLIGACVLLLTACASRTTIQSPWADDAYAGPPLDRVAVVALFDTRADSSSFEDHPAEYLATQGAPYMQNVPAEIATPDPSSWYYDPSARSSYYWYWQSSPGVTGAPGWIEQGFVVAETALCDKRNDLLWTAKSETMDDAQLKRTSKSIVRTVARELFAASPIAQVGPAAAPPAGRN
jgi:hypothetical protein